MVCTVLSIYQKSHWILHFKLNCVVCEFYLNKAAIIKKWSRKTVCHFLKKLTTKLPNDPETSLLGIYPKELKTQTQISIHTLMCIVALFTIAKKVEKTQCPSNECTKKMWYQKKCNTYNMIKYYPALKRNEKKKGMKYWWMLQHGWTSKTLC